MLDASAAFAEAVNKSHRLASRVTIGGLELPVIDGSVTLDAKSAIRGSVSLTLAVDDTLDLVPDDPDALLAPYGNEMVAERGVTYPDGTEELIGLGIYRIDETQIDDDGSGLNLTVTGYDRSAALAEAVIESDGEIAAATTCGEAIRNLASGLVSAYGPWDDRGPSGQSVTLPLLGYEGGDDRWDLMQGIAEACNRYLHFDAQGRLCLVPFPTSQTPVLYLTEGEPDLDTYIFEGSQQVPSGLYPDDDLYPSGSLYPGSYVSDPVPLPAEIGVGALLSISKRWGREDACNRVVVTGQNVSDVPVRAAQTDDDPTSPTYYGTTTAGPFGRVTFAWDSEFVTDASQAQRVATRILNQKKGTTQRIGFSSLVNPCLEPYDTILLRRDRLKVNELHAIDSVTIPLGLGTLSAETRALRVVS